MNSALEFIYSRVPSSPCPRTLIDTWFMWLHSRALKTTEVPSPALSGDPPSFGRALPVCPLSTLSFTKSAGVCVGKGERALPPRPPQLARESPSPGSSEHGTGGEICEDVTSRASIQLVFKLNTALSFVPLIVESHVLTFPARTHFLDHPGADDERNRRRLRYGYGCTRIGEYCCTWGKALCEELSSFPKLSAFTIERPSCPDSIPNQTLNTTGKTHSTIILFRRNSTLESSLGDTRCSAPMPILPDHLTSPYYYSIRSSQ